MTDRDANAEGRDEMRDERGGFFIINNEVVEQYGPRVGANALAAYMVIVCMAGKKGRCWPAVQTIAQKIGVSRPTALKAIETLKDAGLIGVEKRITDKGQRSHVYVLRRLTDDYEPGSKNLASGVKDSLSTPSKNFATNKTQSEQDQESIANAMDSAAPVSDEPKPAPPPLPATPSEEPESVRSDSGLAANETLNVPPAASSAQPVEMTKPKRVRSIQERELLCECGATATGTRDELNAAGWRWKGAMRKDAPMPATCPACMEKRFNPQRLMDAFFDGLKQPPPLGFPGGAVAKALKLLGDGVTVDVMRAAGLIYRGWMVGHAPAGATDDEMRLPPLPVTEGDWNYTIRHLIRMAGDGVDAASVCEWVRRVRMDRFYADRVIPIGKVAEHFGPTYGKVAQQIREWQVA